MAGNPRTEIVLAVVSGALHGAGLGLAGAVATVSATISLGWPAADGIFYLGMFGGAAIGGTACYFFDPPRRLRLQCILAAASIGAFACMIIVLGSGTLAVPLLPHDRATSDLAFEVTIRMLPFAGIGGAIGGGALGPFAERIGITWSRAMMDRFGHRRSG
jgi:hypothetical protein